jgi:hypothetical protein
MSSRNWLAAFAAIASLTFASFAAVAQDHSYTDDGPVVNVAYIRTVDGKFDEYMDWLKTMWKPQQEAAIKAGYLLSYDVIRAEPRSADEPDLLLVLRFKNFAALDGALAKGDAIAKQFEGSVKAANEAQYARSKIRTVLGSSTMQVLNLK